MRERTDPDIRTVPDGAALYLHVPFCAALCDFCAFTKKLPEHGELARYRNALWREWDTLDFRGRCSSAFWGGGTPGLLRPGDIRAIGDRFADVLQEGAEWTIELTPACATPMKLAALREVGVNRVSIGVQSFSPRLLEAMGRPHDPKQVFRAVERIREAGFDAVNIDLIIAAPGQTETELLDDLETACRLEPDHLSAYCLTLEEDTALYARFLRDGMRTEPEREADLYELAWKRLDEAGLRQYEVSNFSRPGKECSHHLNVWHMGDWRGLGPSAASQLGSLRFRNPHDLGDWEQSLSASAVEDVVFSDAREQIANRICFGLRMVEGFSLTLLDSLPEEFRKRLACFFQKLREEGLAEPGSDTFRLTLPGLLLADGIARQCLSILAGEWFSSGAEDR